MLLIWRIVRDSPNFLPTKLSCYTVPSHLYWFLPGIDSTAALPPVSMYFIAVPHKDLERLLSRLSSIWSSNRLYSQLYVHKIQSANRLKYTYLAPPWKWTERWPILTEQFVAFRVMWSELPRPSITLTSNKEDVSDMSTEPLSLML